MKITSKKIEALRPRKNRYVITVDKGLTLRIYPSGKKSWVVRIAKNGLVKDFTIGSFPDMSLAAAKCEARRLQRRFEIEPISAYTLNDAFRLWCNKKRGKIVSYIDEKRRLQRYVMRKIGKYQLDEITAPLIIKTVQPIENIGYQSTLKRVLLRLREVLDLAVCAGYIHHNPCERVSRIFASPTKTPMPAPDWQELPEVMKCMKAAPRRLQILFLFSLCSMLRPCENAMIEKEWISNNTITIPAEKMKMNRSHRVPLTPFMKELIALEQTLSPHPKSKFVFAGQISGHISKQALTKWLHTSELAGKLVAHGLRSMARSWLADCTSAKHEVAEACLAHVAGSQIYRSYQRSDLLDKRRPFCERWSRYIRDCARCAELI